MPTSGARNDGDHLVKPVASRMFSDQPPFLHDGADLPRVADVRQWVATEDHQISLFARGDGAHRLVDPERARGDSGGGVDRLEWCRARLFDAETRTPNCRARRVTAAPQSAAAA
jgi:hypothetical protein